jgi:hypothetical protein
VAPDLGRKLARLQGRFEVEAAGSLFDPGEMAAVRVMLEGPEGDPRRAGLLQRLWRKFRFGGRLVWPRLPLLPARLVDHLARLLKGATATPLLWSQITVGAAGYGLGLWSLAWTNANLNVVTRATATEMMVAAALFLSTALWHELGHAAALRYEEYPPGTIGIGLLVCLPVLYCDVTCAMALPRQGRLRVDGAGMVFQLAAGGLLFLAGAQLGVASLQLAGISSLVAVVWSLLPFLRTDGYWLLGDLVGRGDLESPLTCGETPRDGRRRRGLALFLILYRLAHAIFLMAVAVWLPWRLLRWLPLMAWLKDETTSCRWAAAALLSFCAFLFLLLGYTVARRLLALGAACWQDGKLVLGRELVAEGHQSYFW